MALPVEPGHRSETIGNRLAVCAGIHEDASSDSARYSRQLFEPRQSVLYTGNDKFGEKCPCLCRGASVLEGHFVDHGAAAGCGLMPPGGGQFFSGELDSFNVRAGMFYARGKRAGMSGAPSEGFDLDHYKRMGDAGVTHVWTIPWMMAGGDVSSLEAKQDALKRFGDEVIAKLA